MTFSKSGFKMIVLEPVKKLVRDFNSEFTVWVSLAREYGVVSSA